MLAHLANIELALNARHVETRHLAIQQLEDQAANLKVMKESGAFTHTPGLVQHPQGSCVCRHECQSTAKLLGSQTDVF